MLDFLLIDGDHTYEGVKSDFEMYSSIVRKGGLIAIHDIVANTQTRDCSVNKFWEEVKSKYETFEIVNSWKQGWGGIGLIYL